MKIALVANGGGHIQELRAIEAAFAGHAITYVTLRRPWTRDWDHCRFVSPPVTWLPRTLALAMYLVVAAVQVSWHIIALRPDVVVSTGAELAVPAFWVGKCLRARTIYIESLTRYDSPSRAGRLVLPVTDSFFSQNPEMVAWRPERIRYEGNIL
jgi:beta-1,4-N-acetylglucosaminyltransferase